MSWRSLWIIGEDMKVESQTVEQQEKIEWNGKGFPPVGFECEFKEESPSGLSTFCDWTKCTVLAYNSAQKPPKELQIIIRDDRGDAAIIYSRDMPIFRKQEAPQHREERKRLEAAYDLFASFKEACNVSGYASFDKWQETQPTRAWIAIVDKTNYRK